MKALCLLLCLSGETLRAAGPSFPLEGKVYREGETWFLRVEKESRRASKGNFRLLPSPPALIKPAYDGLFMQVTASQAECTGPKPCLMVTALQPVVLDPLSSDTKAAVKKLLKKKTPDRK